jgi:hypothetical protein
MCGYPGCQAPELEFVAGRWYRHIAGDQGHAAVVGTPAIMPKRVEVQPTTPEGEPPAIEPQTVGGPLESLPRNARRLVELAIPPWTMRWSTSQTFVIVQGRLDAVKRSVVSPVNRLTARGPLGHHRLHASWRNGKFEGCFVDEITRLSSKEMFQYIQREDLTR